MKVYYFTSEKWGLSDIENRRIKISRIEDLNDPFELLSIELRKKNHRQAFNQWRSEINRQFGMICFSETWSNPVMWSHYAEKHRGLCLEFEVLKNLLIPVTYNLHRLPNKLAQNLCPARVHEEAEMRELLATKFGHWKYERERRLFVRLERPDAEDHYYKEFDRCLRLTRVIVGPRSKLSRAGLSRAFQKGAYEHEPPSFKARLAFETFSVVRNKNSLLWK